MRTERLRRRLAEERDAAAVYRALAERREGHEREVLLDLAVAEERHASYWEETLGEPAAAPGLGLRGRVLSWLARRLGSLLVLSLVQRAEQREGSRDRLPDRIAADERVHGLVVAALARRRRTRASGTLRAAVFGANDGLVSNLSLILGVAGAGVEADVVLLTGLAGLLAGALSMAAGEYVSVRSQRELLETAPDPLDEEHLGALRDAGEHELTSLFLAEGATAGEAEQRVRQLLEGSGLPVTNLEEAEFAGSPLAAAGSSFAAFALGAAVPLMPFAVATGTAAVAAGAMLTGLALGATGSAAAILTGTPILRSGLRQLAIGVLAAAVTYGVGSLFGVATA